MKTKRLPVGTRVKCAFYGDTVCTITRHFYIKASDNYGMSEPGLRYQLRVGQRGLSVVHPTTVQRIK